MDSKVKSQYFDIQRRVVANKTTEGWQSVPHVSTGMELDVTDVLPRLEALKRSPEFEGVRLTMNSVLLKIIAEGVKESPHMNAHVSHSQATAVGQVTFFEAIHIATPFRAPDGRMITPVMHDVGSKSLREVCEAMADMRRRVDNTNVDFLLREAGVNDTRNRLLRGQLGILRRLYANFVGNSRLPRLDREAWRRYKAIPAEDRITPDNLLSSTLVVSNVGSVVPGVPVALQLLEIIPPMTTAIGLGSMAERPGVVTGPDGAKTIGIRTFVPMTVCFDHRAMDFEHIAGFIRKTAELCADPSPVMSDE